jgi:hypothetical protein
MAGMDDRSGYEKIPPRDDMEELERGVGGGRCDQKKTS